MMDGGGVGFGVPKYFWENQSIYIFLFFGPCKNFGFVKYRPRWK